MKENEAIEIINGIEEVRGRLPEDGNDIEIAFMMAITALEEIQQYRELGTVEEFQEAVEKQRPRKPKKMEYNPLFDFGWRYSCPLCGCAIGENERDQEGLTQQDRFCATCGQAIDWS